MKCDGWTPKSILKRSRQAVTLMDDVNKIPIVRRPAIADKQYIWWSRAQMDQMVAMQADPLVQSQIHEAKVASQAQSTFQFARGSPTTACMSTDTAVDSSE